MNPSTSTGAPSDLVFRRVMVRINRTIGLPSQSGWPFSKVTVGSGVFNIKLFGTNLSLTPNSLARLEEYSKSYDLGKPVHEHGLRMVLTTPVSTGGRLANALVTGVDVSFRSKDFNNAVEALRTNGFTVVLS